MRAPFPLLAVTAAAVGVAACSVVGDGKVQRIQPQFGVEQTITTTTTTAPTTTLLVTTTSGLEPSTTGVQTEQVRLYFIASGQLTYVTQPLPQPATPQVIMASLQAGPQGDATVALRSAVPSADDAEIRVQVDGGVANVILPTTFFDTIATNDQRLVIGQIVLTLTDSRGVGQVTFNLPVPKPSGELVPAGESLSRNDFAALLDSAGTIDGPAATGSATSTSAPPGG